MLQIISGKFFSNRKINEQESDAILYSNYSWILPVRTMVAELRPADVYRSRTASYVLRYTNRYEPTDGDILVFPPGEEVVEQFRLLASFHFNSYFHVDRDYVDDLCRVGPRHSLDTIVPSQFVPKYFDQSRTGTMQEVEAFPAFIEKSIGMPRGKYRLLVNCLTAFFGALEAIGQNFDLAYSMMVYMLEALSKSEGEAEASWAGHPQKSVLDIELARIDKTVAENIRVILLKDQHFKLMRRFSDFITAHVNDSFFTTEAEGVKGALTKSELSRALQNLYSARSEYVHALNKVRDQLRYRWAGSNDVFHWDNEPHLTFAGLARLSRHVLASFIQRQPLLEREEYGAWREELPGQVMAQWAPQYWVGRLDTFESVTAGKRLSGFVDLLLNYLMAQPAERKPLPDMRPVMQRIEELLAAKTERGNRVRMVALYFLFNSIAGKEYERPGWLRFYKRFGTIREKCSVEMMIALLFVGSSFPWPPLECEAAFGGYQKKRYEGFRLSRVAEVALMSAIANKFLASGQGDKFEEWVQFAILDSSGDLGLQDYLRECLRSAQHIDVLQRIQRGGEVEASTDVM